MYNLQGQVVVVTGAAKGIGKAIAQALGEVGAHVYIADMDGDNGPSTCAEFEKKGIRAEFIMTDITKARQVEELFAQVLSRAGKVDVLVNNAGILADGYITDISEDEWDRVMAVNLKGTFLTCRSIIPHLVERGTGKIINIASMGGKQGFPLAGVHYCATKGGIMAFSRQLALQYSPYGLRVNCVAPGTTATEMIKNRSPEKVNSLVESIPLKRLGMPEDTAQAVLFLASPWADYITGETIDVNGGKYMT